MLTTTQFVSPLELLLNTVAVQYLSSSYCLTVVSEIQYNFNFPTSFINILVTDANDDTKNILVERLLRASECGCVDYIVRMENPRDFMTAFEKANRLGIVRRSDKRIIFLPFPDANYTHNVFHMLTMKECIAVANVLIILPDIEAECESFIFITHKFVGSDSEIDEPLFLDNWNSCTRKFNKNVNLFPHDMTNLKGKNLVVSGFTCRPYVILDLDPTVVPNGRDGIDIRVLDEMCRQINCSIVVNREDKDLWGRLEDGTGILGSVAKNRADMGITGIYAWHEGWQEMDISNSYLNIAVTCLVPAPRILLNWKVLLEPFSLLTWLAVLITFGLCAIALCMARKGSWDKVILIVFGTMIGQIVPFQPQYNASNTWRNRSVLGWLLVTGVILVSAYGAGLASTFTVPNYEASIDTTQDLIERDMKWGGNHDAWIYSIRLSPEPLMKKIAKQFRVYSSEELKKRSYTRSMAFGIEKLSSDTYAIPTFISKEAAINMQILLEDFYYEQGVIIMTKNSPYANKLNQLIGRLHQSGLLIAWVKEVTLKYTDYQVQLAAKLCRIKDEVTQSMPFNVAQMQGIFIFYLIGVNAAFILFLGEIFICYYKHSIWFR